MIVAMCPECQSIEVLIDHVNRSLYCKDCHKQFKKVLLSGIGVALIEDVK